MRKAPGSDLSPTHAPSSQLVSLASEVQDLHLAQRKEMASGFSKGPNLGLLPDVPSLLETLSYSYCYVGIMTGECPASPHRSPCVSTVPRSLCLFCVPALRSGICDSEGEHLPGLCLTLHWAQDSSREDKLFSA